MFIKRNRIIIEGIERKKKSPSTKHMKKNHFSENDHIIYPQQSIHTTTACLHVRDARHLCQPQRTGEMKLHCILPFVFFLFEAL